MDDERGDRVVACGGLAENRDPEDLYIAVWLTIEVIVAAAVYVAIVKLWQHYKSCRSRA
ncbi:hypothetical protein [Paraburkholderia sejongensis]|uniref:hypothetical protein n=1 Tax=Paraburkholderia sejongensis TaxID=2886946 RepID=UPI002E77940E|nr:hypothetical protein [Paraburkholderia sp. MMS20-SJTR3]